MKKVVSMVLALSLLCIAGAAFAEGPDAAEALARLGKQ